MKLKTGILASASMMVFAAAAFTTASAPQNGVYRFTFGVSETQDGSIPVPANAVCDVNGTMEEGRFSYGFLGTTDDSYKNDVPSNLPTVPHAIDGFKVVKGQKIDLHDTTDANGVSCVVGPAASEYLPRGASSFEGRYPVRFSMRAEERAYYAVTCTVANASATANADVTLFSERCHTHAQHLVLAPGETKTFAWSVELAPNYFKTPKKTYDDNAVNVVVVGENAALASLTVVKQPQTVGTVRGGAVANMNVGRTMWLCDDSTGTDQRCDTPYFTLQNYSGVGSGLSRWAPANLSIRNQGEGGLATGANTHRKSCLLKPGDYLYVEYGHNEASTESYTNNLETYFADANEAGANLVIVSPLERHYSWDADNSKWNRTLQGYAEAGEAWVEAKVAAGATNVAFIDLNKPFADWMNAELVRINGINPSIPLKNAIDYYFFSAKGGKVDATHPNPAGSDWGAYFVWSNALERVAAGEAEGATDSQRIQAAVLKGIAEGVQLKVGLDGTADNTPWLVSDEIITAGKASNSYWDATVRAGYGYAKDAAVAAFDASCENGVVTLRGVTMRVMNRLNYTKAVIDIVSADGVTTNRWYSFYNYDASGNASGDLVVPEVGGFIDADLDKDDAGIAAHVSQALTIASGAKAYIWFAEASGNTWQVGGNAPCSAIYPVEAWTTTCLDDDCTDASAWGKTTQAVYTFETSGEEDGISFTSTGANSSGQKKNCGFTRALGSPIASERFRVSFKARFGNGELVFALSNTKGTTTWPMEGGEKILTLDGSANVFGEAGPLVTLSADETPVPQAMINAGEWMDVDMIIDLDALKASASVGGSDYETFAIASASHAPYTYFGITLAGDKAHEGAIDDVRIVALAPAPQPIDYDNLDAHNFVWNPAVAAGDWNNAANWLYEGIAPALTYPSDVSQDVVRFDSAAVVSFPAAAAASNVTFNAAVTMQGGDVNRYGLTARLVDGAGTVTLANSGFANPLKSTMTNTVNIVMTAGTTNHFNAIGTANNDPGIYVRGNISGEGCYQINLSKVRMCNAYFSGNNNDFRGDVYTSGGKDNRSVIYWGENAVGTNTFLHIGHSYGTYNNDSYRMGGSVKFGGVEGGWWDRYDGNVLTIGYLNRDSSINLSNGVSGRANSVAKVGTANLTLGTKTIKNLIVSEGSVTMPVGIAPQTLTIAEGAKIIIVGDATWEENTTTNLFSYTTLAGTGASSLASQIELTGLAANLGAEFTIDAENKKVVATIVKKATPEPSTVAVFLTGGQSNTEGRIPNSDLPAYLATNGRALVSNHSTVSDSTELGTFAPWAPTGKWAYDTEVYYQIAQALGTEFYVVKTSYGGTSISPGVNNSPSAHDNAWLSGYGAGYHWSANADFLAATASAGRTFVKDGVTYDGQSMLKAWIENIDAALDALVADNKTPDVKAIIWHQGESDNNNGNYASDLTAVVTYIRQHIATKLQNDEYLNLPFFCGNIPRRSSLFKAGLDRNFTTIEETANNNMHVVDIYDLTMLSDSKHFDAASAITFGKRLFNRMIDEGVMEGEKVEVEDCVRAPDFGLEQVVNNTTTWTWDGMSGDIATSLTNICGVYFHALNSNSRKVSFNGVAKTVAWTIGGDKTPTEVSGGAYCVAYADNSGTLTATSTAGDSSCGSYMVAVNVGRSGSFEVFYVAGKAGTIKLYLNGREIDSTEATVGKVSHLAGTNTGKGVYYIALGQGTIIGARFVPDEEMPLVTLTIGVDRWTTFGNLYESNFRLPNGVKAYAVSAVDDDPTLLARSKVGAVNIGDAVVVKGPPGTYTLESGEGAAYGGENLMVVQKETGVLAPTSGSDFFNFEFSVQGGKPIFVRAQGDTTLEAGKAFFSITEGDEHAQQSKLRFREQPGLVVIFL